MLKLSRPQTLYKQNKEQIVNTTATTRFVVGDRVTWSDAAEIRIPRIVKKIGRGPFKVLETEDVPLHACSCETPHSPPWCFPPPPHQPMSLAKAVGHPQWVRIAEAPNHQFSGKHFQHFPCD